MKKEEEKKKKRKETIHRRVDGELTQKQKNKFLYGKSLKIDFAFGVKEALGGEKREVGSCLFPLCVHVHMSVHVNAHCLTVSDIISL